MHTTTILTLIIAALVLALIGLASYARRSGESARATGYNQGYDDAKRSNASFAEYQAAEVLSLQSQITAARTAHQQRISAIMDDCDRRIAIFAARSLTPADITTLQIISKQLTVAAETYHRLNLNEQARHLETAFTRLESMIKRVNDATPAAVLAEAAHAVADGKSWLVYGPEGCGKTKNREAIAKALGLTEIVDDWQPGMPVPTTKALVLTNHPGPVEPFLRRVLSYDDAMCLVRAKAQQEVAV